MYSVSAPNWSLEVRTECDDGIQDLDNIKTVVNNIISSLAIVQCEFKNGEVTSQQCEYKNSIVHCENKNDKVTSQQCEYNNGKVTAFQLQTVSETIQWIVHYAGFVYIFEISGKHVEHKHNSSSPINFWLRKMNAAFVRLNNFLYSEANVILNTVLGVGTLNGVGLNYILSCETTADFNFVKKLYLQRQYKEWLSTIDFFCQLLLAIKDWNKQELYNLYSNIKKQWFIFLALNHEKVLPTATAGTPILASYGVEFLVPNLYPNAVSTGLPTSTLNSVPGLQLRHFPSDVWCHEFVQWTINKFKSRFFLFYYSNSGLKQRI